MRILFAGTPETAIPSLRRLVADHDVVGVLTRAPAPVGRKQVLTKSPVHVAAEELGLPVLTPRTLKDPEAAAQIAAFEPDAIAVVAYGLLIPANLLDVPTHGWINLHFSKLPRWRGAAPVQYAIAAGDPVTGTATFVIEAGLDTGDVIDVEDYAIPDDATAADVLATLAESGAAQLSRTLTALENGTAVLTPQAGDPTLAPRLTSADSRVDWTQPADVVANRIRAFTPEPGPWTQTDDGLRVKLGVVRASAETGLAPGEIRAGKKVFVGTGTAAVELTTLAPAGKKTMNAADWLRGIPTTPRFEAER